MASYADDPAGWEEQKRRAREKQNRELADLSAPEDAKQKARDNLEALLAAKEAEMAPTSVSRFGADRWDDAVARYRDMGAQRRAAVQLDQRQADQARGLQMGALGLMDQAAQGNAPSVAEAQGRMAATGIRGAAGQAAAGVRGNQVGAMMGAGRAMSGQLVGSLGNVTMARANEATQDRNAFAQGAAGVRGQDIGAATTNAELVARSRAQDEARQQQFEKMGWSTRKAQLDANVELARQKQDKENEARQLAARRAAGSGETAKTAASIGSAALMSLAMFSDEDTKHLMDFGALSGIRKRG